MPPANERTVPVDDGLWLDGPDGPRLVGSRCAPCGAVTFPRQAGCPRCASEDLSDAPLARRGTLWTWTVQRFPPPTPPYTGPRDDDFEPFGVGYVELAEGVRVEARLTESDPQTLAIGMEMELVLEPFGTDADGRTVVTFAFAPVGADGPGGP